MVAHGFPCSLSLVLNKQLMDWVSLIHLFTAISGGKSLSNFCLKVAELVKEPIMESNKPKGEASYNRLNNCLNRGLMLRQKSRNTWWYSSWLANVSLISSEVSDRSMLVMLFRIASCICNLIFIPPCKFRQVGDLKSFQNFSSPFV